MTARITKLPVNFRPPEPPRLIYHEVSTCGDCDHYPLNFFADETTGTVQCRECGENLNPIWVMKQLYFLVEDNLKRLAKRKRK
jgi:hypothetical protein